MLRRILRLTLSGLVAIGMTFADDNEDGPGRGVARISLIDGDVSMRRGDSGELVAAAINAPLVVQDRLYTGVNSKTEVQFDWANMIRLAGNAEIRLSELEFRRYLIQAARGTMTFRVLRDIEADVEISTPSVAVRPVKKGTYRITVFEDGTSEITVRSGEAEIFTPRGSERLRAGRTMIARGTAADPEYKIVPEIRDDEWDRWNQQRDRDLERSQSYRYLSRDIYGADDLDHHGHWVNVHDYGWVWSPRVVVGWSPYRFGRWSWVNWYGWTWVSHDPWGWAPYHYGRWFYRAPYGWCWYPGAIGTRHYWSPALVAFIGVGRGAGVGVGFGWGHVGWIPLAPREPLHRWWGRGYYSGYRSNTYIDRSVNIVNNVNITNVYRNARIRNSITAVDSDGFSRGRGNFRGLGDEEVRAVSLVRGQVPVVPDRASLRVADRDPGLRHEGRSPDRFFSRRTPAQVETVSFDEQRRGMEQIARRTFGEPSQAAGARDGDGRGLRGQTVNGGPDGTTAGPAGNPTDARGWRRVGDGSTGRIIGGRTDGQPNTNRPMPSPDSAESGRSIPERAQGNDSERGERGSSSGAAPSEWRRFGAPRTIDGDSASGSARGDRAERSGRFGETGTARPSDNNGSAPSSFDGTRGDPGAWRRFEGSRGDRGQRDEVRSSPESMREDGGSRSDRGDRADRSERNDRADRGGRSSLGRSENDSNNQGRSQRSDRGFDSGRGSGEPIRISPPMVRDRGSSGSSGERSAPSMPRGDMGGARGDRGDRGNSAPARVEGGSRSDGGRAGRAGR